ncbi:DUF1349 domain-containing protein [Ruania halotolerans]|uniref:beta-xylosidase family glycoside hydrolase n=1 Tax=Ruania halotolerans TaxID=2897773 RepID=UPI001E60354E|nr:DUF1349 domain-containing protein [Ruania halotolerans]UFU08006.1 DUF1349 domain-containing protein [Ruania halotolerans]
MTIAREGGRRAVAALIAAGFALVTVAGAALPAAAETADPPPGWPEFGYQGVITDKDELDFNPTDEFIFPSVFHAGEHLSDPLGEWYLYYAPHDDPGGIAMMYADSLEGPWTEYGDNPLITNTWGDHYDVPHVSSADAIWNEEAGRMFLYFHGSNAQTRWAESDDGVTFDYGGIAVENSMGGPAVTETSYARVFDHPDPDSDYAYGMFYMGNETDDVRRIRLAESVDGRTWTVDPDYVVAPGEEEGQNVSGGNLWEWNDQLYVIYHASSGNSYARTIDESLRDVGEEPILLHSSSGQGDDVGRVAAPDIVTADGETYLFYESGDRLGATIAYAKEGAEVILPPPFGGFPEDPENPVFARCAVAGSDEFDGDSLAEDTWDRVIRENVAAHEVSDGALSIPTSTGGVSAAPLLQQELPDAPWQVTTRVTIDAQERFQQAGLLLYTDDSHYAKLDLGQATPGPTVELVYHRDGSNRQDAAPPQIEGTSTIWLRYTSDGSTIRASVSYDGETFTRYGREIDVAEAGFTHVGPYAFRGIESTPEIDATFDWFRFSPDAEAYAECIDEGSEPDTVALEALVLEARALDTEGYTEESVTELLGAIAAAEAVLADAQDQAQVDAALAALGAAIDGLESVTDPVPPEPTPAPAPTDPPAPEPTEPPVDQDGDPASGAPSGDDDLAETGPSTALAALGVAAALLCAGGVLMALHRRQHG